MRPGLRTALLSLALLLVAALVLGVNVSRYWPFLADDALISLRYADRLLSGHGLTWTDGLPVEGYSNLLWVLCAAALGLVGVDLVVAVRLLGIGCILVVTWCLVQVASRGQAAVQPIAAAIGLLSLCLSAPIAVWAIGGLEQPLVGALAALSVVFMFRALDGDRLVDARQRAAGWLSVVLALAALTRPDGPLFTVAAASAFMLAAPGGFGGRLVGAVRLTLLPLAAYGAQTIFRYLYYGELVPNTALVKLTPTAVRRAEGLNYVGAGFDALLPLSAVALVALCVLLVLRESRGRALYLLALAGSWSAYLIVIGGDIFPAYRHFVPLVVVMAFALVEAVGVVEHRAARRPWALAGLAVVSAALLVSFESRQREDRQSRRAVTERWEWQCRDLALVLRSAFEAEQPLLAVTAAGCLPYWSKLPSLDMMGLNDHYLPRHPPSDLGTGFLGHELGSGAYVMERQPDLIVFSVGSEPAFRSGDELDAMPEFRARYVPVATRVQGIFPAPLVYVNRDSVKVGVRRSTDAVTIPGYLFRSDTSRAFPNDEGRLVTSIRRNEPSSARVSGLAGAQWHAAVVSPRPDLVAVTTADQGDEVVVTVATTSEAAVEIEAVLLRPLGKAPQ